MTGKPDPKRGQVSNASANSIETIIENFEFIDDWEDRYRYLIELGKTLEPLAPDERTETNKVRGCASQVWLVTEPGETSGPGLKFRGDSDAHIVRGLIAIIIALYSKRKPQDILALNAQETFTKLGLKDHLTPQRSNGLASMVARIEADASARA
ncbi:MAG: SufE family protein [Hyphomicrobiales bacterium]|nr:SufE family protein [Hyphomicrobiales bacterium]